MSVDLVVAELVSRFAPVVYLNDSENFFPCSIDHLLKHSDLYEGYTLKRGAPLVENDLREVYKESKRKDLLLLDVKYGGYVGEFNIRDEPPPMYVAHYFSDRNTILIQYIFIFAYDGKTVGQFKRFTIEIDLNTYKPVAAFFHTYKERGMWVKPENMDFLVEHPVIYCARRTHAFYPKEGNYRKRIGFQVDRCEMGDKWLPKRLVGIDDNTLWVNFEGRIAGKKASVFPGHKKWWKNDKYNWTKSYAWDWVRRMFS